VPPPPPQRKGNKDFNEEKVIRQVPTRAATAGTEARTGHLSRKQKSKHLAQLAVSLSLPQTWGGEGSLPQTPGSLASGRSFLSPYPLTHSFRVKVQN